jgi:DNA-binding NarL/FixJ family response regulator
MHSGPDFVDRAMELGCAGFVAKEDAGSDLEYTIRNLGARFLVSSSAGRKAQNEDFTKTSTKEILDQLTHSERRVLELVSTGATSSEIAEQVGVSARTVDTHRNNIARKLDLKGPNALVLLASEVFN